MKTINTIIAPFATPINASFFGLVLLCLVFSILSYLLLTKRLLTQNKAGGLLGMLSGFIGLVTLCAVIFSVVHARNIKDLVFKAESLQIGSKIISYNKIEKHYLKPLMQKSRYSAELNTDTALIYVIEMRDGKSILFSNENYDLMSVKEAMDEHLK